MRLQLHNRDDLQLMPPEVLPTFTAAVAGLTALRSLSMPNQKLTEIPPLGRCASQLTALYLSRNKLGSDRRTDISCSAMAQSLPEKSRRWQMRSAHL